MKIIRAKINWAEGDSRRETSVKDRWYDTPEDFSRAIHHLTDWAPDRDTGLGYMKISVTLDVVDVTTERADGSAALPPEMLRRTLTPTRWEMYKGDSPEKYVPHSMWIPRAAY